MPYPTPEDPDQHRHGSGLTPEPHPHLPALPDLDAAPAAALHIDTRPIVDGDQAAAVIFGTLGIVAAGMLILASLTPTWAAGALLIAGPVASLAILRRYQLPDWSHGLLATIATVYGTVVLLAAG